VAAPSLPAGPAPGNGDLGVLLLEGEVRRRRRFPPEAPPPEERGQQQQTGGTTTPFP
jgi:hypothetical protein